MAFRSAGSNFYPTFSENESDLNNDRAFRSFKGHVRFQESEMSRITSTELDTRRARGQSCSPRSSLPINRKSAQRPPRTWPPVEFASIAVDTRCVSLRGAQRGIENNAIGTRRYLIGKQLCAAQTKPCRTRRACHSHCNRLRATSFLITHTPDARDLNYKRVRQNGPHDATKTVHGDLITFCIFRSVAISRFFITSCI